MKKSIVNKIFKSVKKSVILISCLFFYTYYGEYIHAQSFSQWKQLAESGNVQAQFVIGNMYVNGEMCNKDFEKAVFWYKKSINNGNKIVIPYLALAYHNENKFTEAYPLFLSFAQNPENKNVEEKMFALSQFCVGLYKLEGMGIEKDESGAIEWLEKAKNNGEEFAYVTLGECYLKGTGIEKNPVKTFQLFKEVYEKFKDRQEFAIKLARCYLEGYGCSPNYEEVYKLVEKIADGSECKVDNKWKSAAQLTLGVAYYKANKYSNAFHWLSTVAENKQGFDKDIVAAQYWLQRCYRFGRGVKQDVDKANEIVRNNPSSNGDVPNLIELLESR